MKNDRGRTQFRLFSFSDGDERRNDEQVRYLSILREAAQMVAAGSDGFWQWILLLPTV